MINFSKKIISLSKIDQKESPLFFNFIKHNDMLPKDVEDKIFLYSKVNERMFGRSLSTKPISKIIDLK